MVGHDESQEARTNPAPRQATDVIAFGQEVGRVLSDGRIVGRAEPFAKVFPSSRQVKRAVGVVAWGILEDIALDAHLDGDGRLVATTNVRRIADNLGLSKNTVTKHLAELRKHGFVFHEEERDDGTGRYEAACYVLDPSACLERFTVTPSSQDRPGGDRDFDVQPQTAGTARRDASGPAQTGPCPKNWDTAPRPKNWDTGSAVSQNTGHRELGQNNKKVVVPEEQPQARTAITADGALADKLTALGVAADRAAVLVAEHPHERIRDALHALEARSVRNPAGWVVKAIREGWDLQAVTAQQRQQHGQRPTVELQAQTTENERRENEQRERAQAWAAAISAALDDEQLTCVVEQVTTPPPALNRRSVPLARAQLVRWAAALHLASPHEPLPAALARALTDGSPQPQAIGDDGEFPDAPPIDRPAAPLEGRIAACLRALEPDLHPVIDQKEAP